MTDDKTIIPVFIPPLAEILAQAEQDKGSPLTAIETVQIRDSAPCIMMDIADADTITQRRGYSDVNPENCWADWHRLRFQMLDPGYLPNITLCLLGNQDFASRSLAFLAKEGIDYELSKQDARMLEVFKTSSSAAEPTLSEQDYQDITTHTNILHLFSNNFTAQDAPAISHKFLRIGSQLLKIGALAMSCNSSGIAHSRQHWLDLAEECKSNSTPSYDFWNVLFRAYVQYPIFSGVDYYTCGMHLLGKPDIVISAPILQLLCDESEATADTSAYLFQTFCLYLLSECQNNKLIPGDTFQLCIEWPQLQVDWEECKNYEPDSLFYNPFGYWRLTTSA